MKPQPDRIVFATERPLQIAMLRQLLDRSGLSAKLSVLTPDSLGQNLTPAEACLVVLDGEAPQPWDAVARATSAGRTSRFVVLAPEVTPQLVHSALTAGIHGVLSTNLPLEEICQALGMIWEGQSQFRFGFGALAGSAPNGEPVAFPLSLKAGKYAYCEGSKFARREAKAC